MEDAEDRARELQGSLMDLVDFIQNFDGLVEDHEQLKEYIGQLEHEKILLIRKLSKIRDEIERSL